MKPIISADSHVLEAPDTYTKWIDRRYKDVAPRVGFHEQIGAIFDIHGIDKPLPLRLVSGAGKSPLDIEHRPLRYEEIYRGGYDPEARIGDQDRDGISAEILYPSVGMVICKHPDVDYRKACLDAYNLWLAEYCSAHPDRLLGAGMVSMRTPNDAIAEVRKIKELGLRGVMLPAWPGAEDYDSRMYDSFWEVCIEEGFPVTFHHLPGTRNPNDPTDSIYGFANRGVNSKLNSWMNLIRGNQDILAMFVFGAVFQRHPKLKLVCAEADAGWVPHFMYRMDYAYDRHRHHVKTEELSHPPSYYFRNNVYLTFQDDVIAFKTRHLMNIHRLLWANDFPHFDSTWPHSQEVIRTEMADLTAAEKDLVLHDNLVECYGLAS